MRFPVKAMLIGILVGAGIYFVPFGFPFFFFIFFIFFIARFLFAPWWWFSRGYRRRYHHRYWPGQSGPDPIDGDYVSQRPATGEGKRFTVN